ncbi:MAG: hypothetical protein NC548_36125 [Lachnospiraceae bacterium]|nr:hypothetical protein [Lachnospiraceae bacterium]
MKEEFSIDEVREAVRNFQKSADYKSTYYETLLARDAGSYISVTETSEKEEVVYTGLYLLSGFLLVHGERFLKHYPFNKYHIKMIYFVMFGIKPEEMATAVSCLEEICGDNNKELESNEIRSSLDSLVEVFFKHAEEIMLADHLWQKKMKEDLKIAKERIDDVVYEYYKSRGQLPLQIFKNEEKDSGGKQ